jgi:HSP20 family molecular chaperone IbpA
MEIVVKELKITKTDENKESFREKVTDLVNDMWDKIGKHHHGIYGTPGHFGTPEADLSETGDVLSYNIELPGLDENDVEVEIEAERLIVRGEKRSEQNEDGGNYIFRERRYGFFERSFILPADINEDKVNAVFDKGVLTVTVPYQAGKKTKTTKIKVKGG